MAAKKAPQSGGSDRLARILLVCVLITGAIVRIANLDVERRSPDELTYTMQAKTVMDKGVEGMRSVVQTFLHTPGLWAYPPPNRVGYIYLLETAMKVMDDPNPTAGSWIACLASMATLGVTALLALRFLGPWPAVLSVFFLAFFPPELVTARRCWSDALVTLAGAGMFYATLDIHQGAKKKLSYFLLPAIGSIAVLIKETTVLLYAACLAASVWTLVRAKDWRNTRLLIAAAAGGAVVAGALLMLLMGGVGLPVQVIAGQAQHNTANQYALEYCSGPGYLLLLAFERLSPLVLVLAVLGLAAAVASPWASWLRQFRPHALFAWLTIVNLAIYMIVPHWLNLRYASAVFAPLCVFAGMTAYWLAGLARTRMPSSLYQTTAAVAAALTLFLVIGDYQRFETAFVQNQGNVDLSVKMVIDATQ